MAPPDEQPESKRYHGEEIGPHKRFEDSDGAPPQAAEDDERRGDPHEGERYSH
jgi:hypothetical protein